VSEKSIGFVVHSWHSPAMSKRRTISEIHPSDGESATAVGLRLAMARQSLGMAQNVFCERAGIHATAYNQYEKGKKRPSIQAAIGLCKTYGMTLDWIFLGDPSNLPYELADAIKALREARKPDAGTPRTK
jgi:DNA-binding XRE family transcriptional regulator